MGKLLTQETVLDRFKDTWADWNIRFDYSRISYVNQVTPVEIYCLIHKELFSQKPCDHSLGKEGCPECKKDNKRKLYSSNKGEFIHRARKVHGEKYLYEKVEYQNARINVSITCLLHGDFTQTPDSHLRGRGCPSCGDEIRALKNALPFDDFKKRANIVHLDKFEYDKDSYFSSARKAKITCPKHGEFFQLPNSHLRGAGCKKCAIEAFELNQRIRQERRAKDTLRKIYGNKYSILHFFLKTYKGGKKKRWFKANCREHGEFDMPCASLLTRGSIGCLLCSHKKIADKQRGSGSEFIARSILLHESFYDYSKVKYKTARIHVTITCPVHGDFEQYPHSHLSGRGCKKCANEALTGRLQEDTLPRHHIYGIYLIELKNTKTKEKFLKVGLTSTSVKQRFAALDKIYQLETHAFARIRYEKAFSLADKEWIEEITKRGLVNPPVPPLHPKGRSFGGHECSLFNTDLLLKYSLKINELCSDTSFEM